MTPFYISYTTSYQSAIVSIALICTIFKLLHVQKYCDLNILIVRGHLPYEYMHYMYLLKSTDRDYLFAANNMDLSSFTPTPLAPAKKAL